MARTITGKLLRDARLREGKESGDGRLHLRGEMVTVDAEFAHLVDTRSRIRRKPMRKPTRDDAEDKQAKPEATK